MKVNKAMHGYAFKIVTISAFQTKDMSNTAFQVTVDSNDTKAT